MIAQTQFKTMILGLAMLKHEMIEQRRMQAMYSALCWHSERELERACAKCAEKYRRFPSIEAIEEACHEPEPEPPGHEQFCYEHGCVCNVRGIGAEGT